MNALQSNRYTESWESFGRRAPRPRQILCISAHWYTRGTAVTIMDRPRTIHDFGGFPASLSSVQYRAPGDPSLASRVIELLQGTPVQADGSEWGLDHGCWSVLKHLYPQADIPVVQLSIDGTRAFSFHYQLAKSLAPLRDEGVLVMGSGNVVHNLRLAIRTEPAAPLPWARRFNDRIRRLLETQAHESLAEMTQLGEDAPLCIPTPEHYLPLLYVIALRRAEDRLEFLTDGIEMGAISMLSLVLDREGS